MSRRQKKRRPPLIPNKRIDVCRAGVDLRNGLIQFNIMGTLPPKDFKEYFQQEVLEWIAHHLGKEDWSSLSNGLDSWIQSNASKTTALVTGAFESPDSCDERCQSCGDDDDDDDNNDNNDDFDEDEDEDNDEDETECRYEKEKCLHEGSRRCVRCVDGSRYELNTRLKGSKEDCSCDPILNCNCK